LRYSRSSLSKAANLKLQNRTTRLTYIIQEQQIKARGEGAQTTQQDTKVRRKVWYRPAHEDNLHVPQLPPASACINQPIQEARIPVRARYQKNPS
jgi:hypothetical protein